VNVTTEDQSGSMPTDSDGSGVMNVIAEDQSLPSKTTPTGHGGGNVNVIAEDRSLPSKTMPTDGDGGGNVNVIAEDQSHAPKRPVRRKIPGPLPSIVFLSL